MCARCVEQRAQHTTKPDLERIDARDPIDGISATETTARNFT